ncbi:MAG TPA: hypothetical protein VKS20_05255 [Candidatus Acidoferrales bacterium]|nr:hypothetical protein [Candidatus Acidoferrales bacterium]
MTISIRNRARASILASLALLIAGLVSGCAVPVAPGYQIQTESLTVHFISSASPHLAIRADYRVQNVGTAPLNFVEVTLPGEKSFGRANFRATVAGREITPEREQSVTDETASAGAAPAESLWRIPLPGSLRQKRKIDVALEYDLAAQPAADPRIFVGAMAFYLNDSGWFPEFQEPKALFAEDIVRPNPADLTVVVPANFLVTASGEAHGAKKCNVETEYRFRIGSSDFDPYVLAGQYREQKIPANGTPVAIWTFQPVSAAQAQQTAAQIAAAAKFYAQNFGPLPKSMKTIYDAELPGNVADQNAWQGFLPGVVYNLEFDPQKSFGAGLNNGLLGDFIQIELGYTWFGHMIRPRPEAWSLSIGLSTYAFAESNEVSTSRTEGIRSSLNDYDNDRSQAVEKPIVFLTPNDPQDQLQIGFDKMQLFFFALEDKCGRQNLIHAISHMVYALRGQQYGYSDFRAALEEECHQNLAGFFRAWLNQQGIPADFRARYENAKPQ